jgi:hypothetical protein
VIRGLVRKEVRDLRPFIGLAAFLLLLEAINWFLQQFTTLPLDVTFVSIGSELGVVLYLLAFAVGTGMLIREVDDRTLGFLDGLPVTRLRVFSTKFLVTAGMLLLYPAGYLLLMLAQHAVARGSLDQAMHPGLLVQAFALISVVTAVGLASGMLLGFLRSLGWLALALCVITLKLIELKWPAIAVVNPVELLRVEIVGVQWRVSSSVIAVQAAILAGCLMLSLFIFVRAGGDQGWKLRTQLSRPLVSAAVTLATIGAGIGAVALMANSSGEESGPVPTVAEVPGAEFKVSPAGSARTEYYSFNYPAQQTGRVQALLSEADALYLAVADILGAPPGARIDVDLSESQENTEGTASHDSIRMDVDGLSRITLAHETAHVLAGRLAGGERERELLKMRALSEGLATWIGNQVAGEGALPTQIRFTAAIVSQRRLVRAEVLMDSATLARVADQNLDYPLGAVLVDATMARYGSDALHKLLVAIGNQDFPRDLAGSELWHAAYQAAGFDLALVLDDYARNLKTWELEFADRIAAVPRPRGSLVVSGKLVGVEVRLDGELPEGWTTLVRFRPSADSELFEYTTVVTDEQRIALMPVAGARDEVCFQPGVARRGLTIFESWVCLPVDSAARL